MLNLASQEDECPSSGHEGQVSSSVSQGQGGQKMRCGLSDDSFQGKCSADSRARVTTKRPSGDYVGSTEYSRTKEVGEVPSMSTRKRCGTPLSLAAE